MALPSDGSVGFAVDSSSGSACQNTVHHKMIISKKILLTAQCHNKEILRIRIFIVEIMKVDHRSWGDVPQARYHVNTALMTWQQVTTCFE